MLPPKLFRLHQYPWLSGKRMKEARLHCRPQIAILCMWPMWPWKLRTLVAFVLKAAWCNQPHFLNPSHLKHNWWIVQHQTSQDPSDQDFFKVLKYTADCGNLWFRELYKFGVLIPSVNAAAVAPMAWGLTETRIIIGYFIPLWISCVFCQNKKKTPACMRLRKGMDLLLQCQLPGHGFCTE